MQARAETKREPIGPIGAGVLPTDEALITRVLAGEIQLFELIMRRYNSRLYRVARSILKNDAEAEDVMQDAYVRAYEHLSQFEGRSSFATWLTRIAVHEASRRARLQRRFVVVNHDDAEDPMYDLKSSIPDPEQQVSGHEAQSLLEHAIESLPDLLRPVYVFREVEQMTTAETAEVLNIAPENVRIRLHRARLFLKRTLLKRMKMGVPQVLEFHAIRCDRVVQNVMRRIS